MKLYFASLRLNSLFNRKGRKEAQGSQSTISFALYHQFRSDFVHFQTFQRR